MAAYPRLYSPYDKPMWDSITENTMRLQCCAECSLYRYPPGACCPNCLSTAANWEKLSGKATVLSWTTYHRQYLPAYPAPHTVVAVQLAEGPIMIGNIDVGDTPKLKAGVTVELIYGDHPDGYRLPRFRLEAA
jgi:uncharacterized OB-fold protein